MVNNSEMVVTDSLCRARVKANEQRIEKTEEKLEHHEATLASVSECLAKLTALYEASTTDLKDARARLHTLETKPIDRWEKIITGILSGGGGAVFGALLMKLIGG